MNGRIRKFYRDVLGCKLNREFEEKDDFRVGDDYYISFLYGGTDGKEPDKAAAYAQADALSDEGFLKAIFLELKTDDVQGMRQRITDFGVKVVPVPDPPPLLSGSWRTSVPAGRSQRGPLEIRGEPVT